MSEPRSSEVQPLAHGPLRDESFDVGAVRRDTIHQGRVWDVVRDAFEYNGSEIVREVVDHPGAVAILALDDDARVLLIKQYRHPIRAKDWEIPAGLLDVDGEPPLEAARRELAEEADLAAAQWDVLAEFWNSPGGSTEAIRIYLARGLTELPAFDRVEEEADMERRWVPLDDVVAGVLARRLQSPSLAFGALAAKLARDAGWSTLAPGDAPWPRHPRLGHGPW